MKSFLWDQTERGHCSFENKAEVFQIPLSATCEEKQVFKESSSSTEQKREQVHVE